MTSSDTSVALSLFWRSSYYLFVNFDRVCQVIIKMSRHKLVKALDLDEELDDFDGGVDPDYEEEIGADDKGTYILPSVSHLAGTILRSVQNTYAMEQAKYAVF